MDLAIESSAISHCGSLAVDFPVPGLSFMLPDAKSFYVPIAELSVLEGLLGRKVAGNRHAPGSRLPCILTFQCPGNDNSPLFRGVTTHTTDGSVQLSCRKKRIGRCLYLCRVTGH